MELTALFQNSLAARLAEATIAALWQGALIAGALAICLRLLPRVAAAYRFAMWAAAFTVLAGLSVFSLLPELSVGSPAHVPGSAAGHLLNGAMLKLDARWSLALAGLWLMLALVRAVDLAVHSLRLRRLWREAKPVALDEQVDAVLKAAVEESGRGPVEVCTTVTLQRPSVIGFFRPRILIPDWLFARLTQGELEQIVLHEMEHLRRRDDWTNLAQKLCLAVFPLNPALAWIERRLSREREMACDEGVVRVTRAPRAYAACLTSLAERGLERRAEALSLGAWQRRPELVHRVHSILRGKGGLNPVSARVLLGTLGCGLIAGSVELAQSPQLVAFVPERSMVANDRQGSADADLREHAVRADQAERRSGGQFTAVKTSLREPAGRAMLPAQSKHSSMKVTRALPVTAKKGQAEQIAVPVQQWVVLTAWTQVESGSAVPAGRVRADYDVNDADSGAGATQQVQAPASQITVTQLIFTVQPVSAGSRADAGASSAMDKTKSNTPEVKESGKQTANPATNPSMILLGGQPGIATIRDGWLVLQL